MAKKKLTPEEVAAEAENAKAAKPSAQEMSGGAVKPAPKPDAAAKGAAAMDDFINPNAGTKAAGQTNAEARAAFQETKAANQAAAAAQAEKRFTMVSPEEAASKATAAETGAAKMAAAAQSPGMLARAGRALASPAFVVPAAVGVADAVVPRASDATGAGYDINTARDAAVNATNYGALAAIANNALKFKSPYLVGGAAALGAGKAIYDRLSDYHSENPQADEQPYALPEAKPNFWEQAPAAVSDAGRVASQILRGVGDGTGYLLNNYTPYPYLKQANDAVADYFTPESMKQPAQPEPLAPAQEPVQPPVESAEGPLPANTERLSDGRYQQKLYGPDGTYRGTATGSMEQIDRVARPSAEESSRKRVDENIDRIRFTQRAQQEQDFRERTSPEAAQKFFAEVDSKRLLRDALGVGNSPDPIRNAETVKSIADAAESASRLTGQSVDELLPKNNPRYPNRNVELARQVLRARANGQNPTQAEIATEALAMQPTNLGDQRDADYKKQAANQLAPALSQQDKTVAQEATASKLEDAQERLALQQANAGRADEALELRRQTAQTVQENAVLNQIARSQGQIAKYTTQLADPLLLPEAKQALQEQMNQAQNALGVGYARAKELGIDLGEAAPEEPSASPAASLANLQKLSAQDLEALSWANSNPDDPRSQDIKNKIQAKLGS
jgi:hypothetical protein